ncbi:MAG: hypothetical protein ACP5P1_15400 [Acidimicrobiales bacterium]
MLVVAGRSERGQTVKTTANAALLAAGGELLSSDVIATLLAAQGHSHLAVSGASPDAGFSDGSVVCLGHREAAVHLDHPDRPRLAPPVRALACRGRVAGFAFAAPHSPEVAPKRVAARVALGGRDVLEAAFRRRPAARLRLSLDRHLTVGDESILFDSSRGRFRPVAGSSRDHRAPQIADIQRWALLRSLAV